MEVLGSKHFNMSYILIIYIYIMYKNMHKHIGILCIRVCEYTHIHTYKLLEIEAVMPGARKPTYL